MTSAQAAPVFVTARFRSGSTLLWLIGKKLPEAVAFYEPCHDNLLEHVRGNTPPQAAHAGVDSYWDEYRPILDELGRWHRNAFGVDRLLLESDDAHPALESYIRFLLESCGDRQPFLQFNRVDFRLPWLRAKFPQAKIIHLYRDPITQWQSMVRDVPADKRDDPMLETDYELSTWAFSLSNDFPFLLGPHIRHPYQRHYLLWKLSLLMGRRHSDLSLAYEDFQNDSVGALQGLLQGIGRYLSAVDVAMAALRNPREKARDTHPSSFYDELARECDLLLSRLGLDKDFGLRSLREIRAAHADAWEPHVGAVGALAASGSCLAHSELRSRYLRAVTETRRIGGELHAEGERRMACERRIAELVAEGRALQEAKGSPRGWMRAVFKEK